MSGKPHTVHTIGHSDLDREKFMDRLEQNGIQLVADVRSMPHSRHAPQFNQEELAWALDSAASDTSTWETNWAAGPGRTGCTTNRAGPATG